MIESGNDDLAVGPAGEISRFQISRELWPGGDAQDEQAALAAAQGIMQPRLDEFLKSHKRGPTDLEFYILWNAPSQIDRASANVLERARRFANLVQR